MKVRGYRFVKGLVGIVFIAFLIMHSPVHSHASKKTKGPKGGDQTEAAPGPDETLIYVIRKKAMAGAMMSAAVGCNGQLVATLKSGTYCAIRNMAGPITINIIAGPTDIPLNQLSVDNRGGETVYLLLEFSSGNFYEISESEAAAFLNKYKKRPNLPAPKPDPVYETEVINPGVRDDGLMKNADSFLEPDADHAVITFLREPNELTAIPTGVWQDDVFVGSLRGLDLMQIKVTPGKYRFFGRHEHWSVLDAEVEAGKNYYVRVTLTRGWKRPHVRLLPVKSDVAQHQIDTWMSSYENLVWDEANTTDELMERLQAAFPLIEKAKANVENGTQETRVLAPSDGR